MAGKPNAKSISKTKKNKTGDRRISTGLLSVLIVIVMTILIVGICLLVYMISFINGDVAINLDSYINSQDQTSIIYAMDDAGEPYEFARLHGEENRIWVDLEDIPEDVQNAFVCLEDKRFYNHSGVDWIRTLKAVITLGKSGGGSTITQQLIKNLTEENQATVSRKFNEILYALNLEKNYDKPEILEAYLNTIPLGSGSYGVQTAAQKYFGKDVSELNAAEAATLAPITKAPTRYNPLLNPENNKERQETCLWNMYDQGKLTKEEYESWVDYELILTNSDKYVPDNEAENSAPKNDTEIQSYYVDFVVDSVIADLVETYGETENEAWRKVYYGGLKIYACIDEDVQKAAEDVYVNRTGFPSEPNRTETGTDGTKRKLQSAITIMDYEGRVVAIVGGAGPKTTNRGLNRAADSPRSPGSSIKPLSVYTPAIENDLINYSSMVQNYGIVVSGKRWPQNYSGGSGSATSYVTTQYAVAQSLNTTSARVLQKLTIEKSMDFLLNNFHLTTLETEGANTDANFSSLAVGGMSHGVTTLEMAAAYATFGNGGNYYEPYCYYKVTDSTGTILENTPVAEQVISKETATIMNRIMQTVVKPGGTGSGQGVSNFTTYMKTGTTSDVKDKWACGGTPYYVAAVWLGYDIQEEILGISSAVNPAAKIWSTVMNKVHSGLAEKEFQYAPTVVTRAYCTKTGLLASDSCASKGTGYYQANKLPGACKGNCGAPAESTTNADASAATATTTAPAA